MRARAQLVVSVALWIAVPSAAQVDAVPGNALNPPGGDTTRIADTRGMSHLRTIRRRSPAGLLYPDPLVPNRLSELAGSWLYRGSVEFGGLWTLGDVRETRFNEYADWSNGAFLRTFDLALAKPESGIYTEVAGGSAGRDDQYFYGDLGIAGFVRLRGIFSGLPHTFAADATNPFDGAGSEVLRLPEPLLPGANSDTDIASALQTIERSTLSVQRNATQLSLDYRPLDPLTLFARYSVDAREGARPYGGSLIFDTGGEPARAVETTEPRSDRTHNFFTGVQFRSDPLLANVEYAGSVYQNHHEALTWDNPFELGTFNGAENVERGRFALAPDNQWHNVKADIGVELPWSGRLASTLSWGRMRQDDDLLPPTVNSGVVGFPAFNGVDLDEWNTRDSLPRGSADARVDTLLFNARLNLRPFDSLRVQGGIRYYDQQNETRYTAFNPMTDQRGFIAEDGALNVFDLSRVFEPGVATDDFRYRSSPYGYRKLAYEFTADYHALGRTTLHGGFRREEIEREERERAVTRENQARVSLTSRDVSWATLRASYDYRDRGGSPYDSFPNRDAFVSSLEGFVPFLGVLPPNALADLRKYDLADRTRHDVKLSAALLPREDLDLAIGGRFVDEDYGASYGLEKQRWGNANLDLNFQPSPAGQAYLFGQVETRERRLAGINDAFAFSSDPNAGGAVFPFENAWRLDATATSWSIGAGLRIDAIPRIGIDLNYSFISSREAHVFEIAGSGALGTGLSEAEDLPDLLTRNHLLTTSIRFSLIDDAFLRIFHRFERSAIRDFSQSGLDPEKVLNDSGALFLGHVDRDFDAHMVGVTIGWRL